MSDLSQDARTLIARSKDGDEPSAHDAARVLEKLEAKWLASVTTAPAAGAAAAGGHAPASVTKWLRVSLSGAATLVIGFLLVHSSTNRPRPGSTPAPRPPRAMSSAAAAVASAHVPAAASPVAASGSLLAVSPRPASQRQSLPALRRRTLSNAQPSALVAPKQPASPRYDSSAVRAEPLAEALPPAAHENAFSLADSQALAADAQSDAASPSHVASEQSPAAPPPPIRADSIDAPSRPASPPTQRAAAPAPHLIGDELSLLGAAQRALQDHEPKLALQLAERHGFLFPAGALVQERLALQAFALCALRRNDEARLRLRELARRVPGSPLLARVRERCRF